MNEFENQILTQINKFRNEPKVFLEKELKLPPKNQKDFKNFINSLDKKPILKLNDKLCNIAKEEAKKFYDDPAYNKYQIGNEILPELSPNFSRKDSALIAIDNLDNIDELIPIIIINDLDKSKKGRKILANSEYTHIGIGYFIPEENEESEEISYILIFSKLNNTKENENENEIKEDSSILLSKEENEINEQIKKFRENPKKFVLKKCPKIIKNKFRGDYESFLLKLDKMPELILDKTLCLIAKDEIKKLSEDDEYNKIQIGEELNIKFNDNFIKKDSALIALEKINNSEELIPRIIINESDTNKNGRLILSDIKYTHIGISQLITDYGIYVVIIFSKIKKKDKEKIPELETIKEENEINVKNKDKIENNKKNIINDNIYKNMKLDDKNMKIQNKNNLAQSKMKEINNIIDIFFFTSIQYQYKYGYIEIKIDKIEGINHKKIKDYEYKEIFDNKQHYYDFYIYYFKLKISKNSKFQLFLSYDNYYFFYSDIIEVTNNNLLGYLQLYSKKSYVNQIIYKENALLVENQKLLNYFGADKKFLIPFLERYKLSKNSIKSEELLYLLNIFSEYNCKPFFIKELKWDDIEFNNKSDNIIDYPITNIIRKIISILNNELQWEKDNEKIKDIILKLYGYIYFKYSKNQFKNLMKNDDLFKESIKRLIKTKIITIHNLIKKDLIEKNQRIEIFNIVIENETTEDGLKTIFNGFNLIESLKLLVIHYEQIKSKVLEINGGGNIFIKNIKKIFSSIWELQIILPDPSEKDNIDEIFNFLKQYLEKAENDEINIINLDNLIIKIKEVNEKYLNLENLFKIKEEVKYFHEKNKIQNNTLFKIMESIHDVGISLSSKKRFSNIDIINFISKDIFYISDDYNENSKRDPNIFMNFDIHEENKLGFKEFVELKLYLKFKAREKGLYEIFINKIKTLDDLNILFQLFPKDKLNSTFLEILLKKMKKIANNYSYIINEDQLFENMYIIILNIIRNQISIYEFTDIIENSTIFGYNNRIRKVYIYILTKNDDKINNNKNIIDKFINYFIDIIDELDAKGIYYIIKSCDSNKKFLIKIFNNKEIVNTFVYTEDDIYSPKASPNLDLYKLFIDNKYIEDIDYLNTKYFESISELNNKLYLDLNDLNISYLIISDLIHNNPQIFYSKIKLIFINDKNKTDEIYNKICEYLEKCNNKFSGIERILNYLIDFEPISRKKLIIDIRKINNSLRRKKIKEILEEKETEQIEGFNELLEKSKNIRFKYSIIFMLIYEEIQKDKIKYIDIELFNETLENYQIIIKKIINYKNENFLKIEKIEKILNLLRTKKDEIEEEMKFISKEFESYLIEKNENIQSIKHNLINFSNLKEIKEYINGTHWIMTTFKSLLKNPDIQETEYTTNLSKAKEALSVDNIKSNDVENAINILKDYDIDIKDNNDFNIFILKIYGKEDELKFCIGKKDEDIKNLNEYLIDRQNESGNLQPEDFDDLIGCKKYVNEIIESHFLNDKDLFNALKTKFNDYKNFILKINNYLEKYGEIKELYDFSFYT